MATSKVQAMRTDAGPKAASLLGGSQAPKGTDTADAAALRRFFTLSVASGIINLGVLLEILHVANYDAEKACRIVELIKGSPPREPAIIATSQQYYQGGSSGETRSPNSVQNADCAVQAFGDGLVSSAAAASPYSAAVVSCAPGSAGVGVGTSSGTTTSTAVPLSAVTSLPQNSNINVDFSQPGCAKCSISSNKGTNASKSDFQAQDMADTKPKDGLMGNVSPEQTNFLANQTYLSQEKNPTNTAGPMVTNSDEQQPSINRAVPRNPPKGHVEPVKPHNHAVATGLNVNESQAMDSKPNFDDADPLKVAKLQEIIDMLKT